MDFSYPLFQIPFVGYYLIFLAFLFGAVFASFITCTAWRVVRGEDWMLGHSHCDTCGHELSTADLFPIVSYIALKGKCRYCGSKVPPRDLIFEIILGVLFAVTLALHGVVDAAVISALALEMLLLGLSLADWDSGVISGGFLAAILVVWILSAGFRPDIQRFAFEGVIASLAAGLLISIGTAIAGKILKTKVNYGPAKLAMCLLIFLGFKGSVIAMGVAVVLGIVFAIVCRARKRKLSLAPAISIGFVAAFLVKDLLVFLGV